MSQPCFKNRHCFLKVLGSLRFLARQGCALRGNEEGEGNLMQLMKLIGESDSKVILINFFITSFLYCNCIS